jgi:hypothetical protein
MIIALMRALYENLNRTSEPAVKILRLREALSLRRRRQSVPVSH